MRVNRKKHHSGQLLCGGQTFFSNLYNPVVAIYISMKQGVRPKDTQPEVKLWDLNQVLCCSTMDKERTRQHDEVSETGMLVGAAGLSQTVK